jgi:hypothetical protein
MKTFDITDIEQAAEESEQDRRDHRKLGAMVEEITKHEDAMRVPCAMRRLIDNKVDPVVIAKTLLVGDRDGGVMYRISTRSVALAEDEQVTQDVISIAIRDMDVDLAATYMIGGAVWLATQFGLDRELLTALAIAAERRPRHPERAGYGVIDLVDAHGVGDRSQVVTAIKLAQLPSYAPLEYRPGTSS